MVAQFNNNANNNRFASSLYSQSVMILAAIELQALLIKELDKIPDDWALLPVNGKKYPINSCEKAWKGNQSKLGRLKDKPRSP
jgi:hypothetical protein